MGLDLNRFMGGSNDTSTTNSAISATGALNLRKGERVSLTKDNVHLDKILVGLGWDANASGGFDFDLDASAYMCGKSGKVEKQLGFIYFNNLKSPCGSVMSMGDNRTGAGDGDDEQIKVQLSKVPADIDKVVFTVTIYDARARRQNFGQVNNSYIRIEDEATGREILRFNLTEDYSTACSVVVAEIYRNGSEWKFNARGEGVQGEIDEVCRMFGLM